MATTPATTDWLTSFLQQNGMTIDKMGNVVTAPAGNGMVQAFGGATGAPVATSGATGGGSGIDPARLWSNAQGLDPNAPPIFSTKDLTFNKGSNGNQVGTNYGSPGQLTFQTPGWSATDQKKFNPSNFTFGGTADAPKLMIKNADKTGLMYSYTKSPDGQYWIPSQQGQLAGYDTNNASTNIAALTAVTMGLGGWLGGGAAAADAGAGAGGGVATSAPAYGGVGTAGAGAGTDAVGTGGGLLSGTTLGDVAQAGGAAQTVNSAVNPPSSNGGSGNGYLDSGGQTTTTAPGQTGNGVTTPTTGSNQSLLQQLLGSSGTGTGSSLWNSLLQNPQLLSSLTGAIGGSLGQNAITGNNAAAAQQASGAYAAQSNSLSNLANQVRANGTFQPVGYTNASGGTTWDPATNSWKTSLSPEAQTQSDMWGQLAQQSLQRNQNLDPNALASQYQSQVQSLLAPQRQQALDSTIGTLMSKGLLGQGVNQTGAGAVNPLLASLSSGNAAQDTQVAMAAQQYGQTAQNNGLTQLAGLFGQQGGLNSAAANTFNPALQGTQQQVNNTNVNNSLWSTLMQGSNTAALNSNLPNANLLASQNSRDAGNYGMWTNLLKGLFSNPGTQSTGGQ